MACMGRYPISWSSGRTERDIRRLSVRKNILRPNRQAWSGSKMLPLSLTPPKAARLRKLNGRMASYRLPVAPDSFAFAHANRAEGRPLMGRSACSVRGRPIFVISIGRDGGLKTVWVKDREGRLSGILIDVSGRLSDRIFLDRLLGNGG